MIKCAFNCQSNDDSYLRRNNILLSIDYFLNGGGYEMVKTTLKVWLAWLINDHKGAFYGRTKNGNNLCQQYVDQEITWWLKGIIFETCVEILKV